MCLRPKLVKYGKYVFLIYSSDLSENRKHIHVETGKGRFRKSAKFWLEPDVELVDSGDFTIRELKIIIKIINENKLIIILQIEKKIFRKKNITHFTMNGIYKIKPCIIKISFPLKGKMKLHLKDEREIIIPVKYFEKIRKMTREQREKWYVLDEQMFPFDD